MMDFWRRAPGHADAALPPGLAARIPGTPPGAIDRHPPPWYGTHGVHTRCTRPGLMALTFDDAPGARDEALLAELRRLGVPATFFAVGSWSLRAGPAGLTRLLAGGHQVGMHSYSHSRFAEKHRPRAHSAAFFDRELNKTEGAFRELLGGVLPPRYFR